MEQAEIIFLPYNYLIDPAVRKRMKIPIKDNIIILDEAHNIDDVCIEAYSVKVNKLILEQSTKNLSKLKGKVDQITQQDLGRLE